MLLRMQTRPTSAQVLTINHSPRGLSRPQSAALRAPVLRQPAILPAVSQANLPMQASLDSLLRLCIAADTYAHFASPASLRLIHMSPVVGLWLASLLLSPMSAVVSTNPSSCVTPPSTVKNFAAYATCKLTLCCFIVHHLLALANVIMLA